MRFLLYVLPVVLETVVILIFLFLPDKFGWKKWSVSFLLIIAIFFCVYFPLSEHLERTHGYSFNFEACYRAENLIKNGKHAQLAESMNINWWNETSGMNLKQIAKFFLDRVQKAEASK